MLIFTLAVEEIYISDGRLIEQGLWKAKVGDLRVKADKEGLIGSREGAVGIIAGSFLDAVRKRVPEAKFGVMFSGGVDSSLIAFLCRKLGRRFTCYTAGFRDSGDVAASKIAAEYIGLSHRLKIFSLEEVEQVIRDVLPVLKYRDFVNVSVASVVQATVSMAKNDGVSCLFSGLGSEEIFAGYRRHELAGDVNAECWSGLESMWARDLSRDCCLAEKNKVDFLTPFLDENLIVSAMRVPGEYKILNGEKKLILRESALSLGLQRDVAFRRKVAAQYGSGFDAAIQELARQCGFRSKAAFVQGLLASDA